MITAAILSDGQRIDIPGAQTENEAYGFVQAHYPGRRVLTYIHGSIKAKGFKGVQRYVEDMNRGKL